MLLRMSSFGRIRRYAATVPPTVHTLPPTSNTRLSPLVTAGKILLHDDVAVAADRGDHLGHVGGLAPPQIEDVLSAEPGQRLDDGWSIQLAQKRRAPAPASG